MQGTHQKYFNSSFTYQLDNLTIIKKQICLVYMLYTVWKFKVKYGSLIINSSVLSR